MEGCDLRLQRRLATVQHVDQGVDQLDPGHAAMAKRCDPRGRQPALWLLNAHTLAALLWYLLWCLLWYVLLPKGDVSNHDPVGGGGGNTVYSTAELMI